MRRVLGVILTAGLLTASLVNAEPYKGKSFPSDEVITKNIPIVVNQGLRLGTGAEYDVKVQKIIGKIDKENKSHRIFYCFIYKVKDFEGATQREGCGASHIFKLDTDVWIMEHENGWTIIEQ